MKIEFYFYLTDLCEKITWWYQGLNSIRSLSVVCFIFSNSFNSFSLKLQDLMINHFWGVVRTPVTITNPCVKIGITNQQKKLKNNQEIEEFPSNCFLKS